MGFIDYSAAVHGVVESQTRLSGFTWQVPGHFICSHPRSSLDFIDCPLRFGSWSLSEVHGGCHETVH